MAIGVMTLCALAAGYLLYAESVGRTVQSVEAHVLRPEYAGLFTPEERHLARARLREHSYPVPGDRPEVQSMRV